MSNVFQTYLKDFKLKKIVVKPKTTQSIEPINEQVNPQLNQLRVQKTFSLF